MECLLFFYHVGAEVQRLFPVIYDTHDPYKDEKKVDIGAVKKRTHEQSYWEIVAVEMAKLGVFNIRELTPLEAVMEKRAYDVLRVYNLHLVKL
jgi:hypothetical protein